MTLSEAIDYASAALAGKTEKNGNPYIDHSLRVMDKMQTEEEKLVAIFHDVVEDSECTFRDLRDLGLPRNVMEAIETLTKRSDMTYFDYIDDVRWNELACKVKIAEIEDNQDIFRVNKMSFQTYTPAKRAEKALAILRR